MSAPLGGETTSSTVSPAATGAPSLGSLIRPGLRPWWLEGYRRADLAGDITAGVIVAVMLVPQGMAYALLAGLPPQVGLYASLLPLAVYALLGTSRALAVGPVAMVSLLVASGVGALAEPGSAQYLTLALTLALLVGLIQTVMGLARLGRLVNLLSHAVLSGFTSAAALVIALSQLKHVLGVPLPRTESALELLVVTAERIGQTNPVTLALGLGGMALLLGFYGPLARWLDGRGVPETVSVPLTRSAPLALVLVATLLVAALRLDLSAGVAVVGDIPRGLPSLTRPALTPDTWRALLPTALAISVIGFAESYAVAKALASRRRERIGADRELVALGMANVAAAFSGGYPVTGGFSRSVVNFAAGARSGLATLITAALIALTVLLLTPLFAFLPPAALAAVIIVAVLGLIDLETPRRLWRYDRADALALGVTFVAVLAAGIEVGLLTGIALSVAVHVWRTSTPHTAVVGRVGRSEHFRNVERHDVHTCDRVCTVRVDESLYFANAQHLERWLLGVVADHPALEHLVLVCSAVNRIDGSAFETLEALIDELRDAGVTLHLAAVKGPVMDRLARTGFVEHLAPGRVFLSTHEAVEALEGAG